MAIPTATVLLVASGGVLIYAAFTNQNPLAALKSVASGKPATPRNSSGVDPTSFNSTSGVSSGGGGIYAASFADIPAGAGTTALPRALERFANDRYSQTNRTAPGFSDCSSFIGKGLTAIGVKPPAGSTTASYLASKDWKRVASPQAGDLAISLNHVVVCYGNGYGIGQQNPRVNVQRGTVDDLMYGNKPYIYLRYVSGTAAPSTAKTPPNSVMA